MLQLAREEKRILDDVVLKFIALKNIYNDNNSKSANEIEAVINYGKCKSNKEKWENRNYLRKLWYSKYAS